jgi:hypothetical protein
MPTISQIRTEIETGPLSVTLFPLLVAGNDQEIADALNEKNVNGYVPARHVSVSLANYPVLDALIHWVLNHATLPTEFGGGVSPFSLYTLFKNLDRIDKSVNRGDLKATVTELIAGFALATSQGIMGTIIPTGFDTFLLEGEQKISRAEQLWGFDTFISVQQVGESRNNGGE